MKAYNSEFEQDSFWNWNRRSFNNSSRRIVSHFFILASRNSIRKSYECVVNQFLVSRRISVFRDYKILAPSFLRMASSYLQTHDFLNGTEIVYSPIFRRQNGAFCQWFFKLLFRRSATLLVKSIRATFFSATSYQLKCSRLVNILFSQIL